MIQAAILGARLLGRWGSMYMESELSALGWEN